MGALKNDSGLDIRMLRIFAAVAGADSLSAAAEALGVTQSAVSQTISQIEATLGMRVLDRTRRPYRLTPAGVTLQRQSRQIVDDVDRLIAQVREADLMNRPAIRIGMIDSFAATTGPAIVKRLTQSASQVLVWSGLAYGHAGAAEPAGGHHRHHGCAGGCGWTGAPRDPERALRAGGADSARGRIRAHGSAAAGAGGAVHPLQPPLAFRRHDRAPYAPRQRDRAAVPGDRYQRCGDGDDRGQPGLGATTPLCLLQGRSAP